MKFSIQTSNPQVSNINNPEDKTLDECIETCFLLNTEVAIIEWLGIFIPLSYKYSISIMFADILLMLQELLNKQEGRLNITWPSSDFNAQWHMIWKDNNLEIKSEWSVVIGKTEPLLNKSGVLKIHKSEFISEWKTLLKVIINSLVECKYDKSHATEIEKIKNIYIKIDKYGSLYK